MYKGKFAAELPMNEVKEYYDKLRQCYPLDDDQRADFNILKEKLILFAYKTLEQGPSEDAISRQAALNVIEREQFKGDAISEIEKLPPVTPQPMKEKWQELKETIIEMRDNNGTGTQQETCKFLANLMDVLEKQVEEKENEKEI